MIENLESIVKDLISHTHEEEWFEFKENWFEPHALGEYISALSNVAALLEREYSYLVWGVENNSHKVVGTSFDYHRDVSNEPLQHYLARLVKPDIGFEFQEIMFENKLIVVLCIPAANKIPTSFDKIRYSRIESSKINLMDYPERESQLFDVLRNGLSTIENTEAEFQDLTFGKLFMYYEVKGITLNKRTFKKNLGLLTQEGKFNLLAQLLSDDSHIPIRFSLFNGTTKASTMYSVREFGNTCLLYSLDDVLRYGEVLNIPQADERNRVVERKEVMLFNDSAFREAVVNAFIHNRWVDGNAPMFSGFRDRIEILSRGALPPKQTLEGFYAGESVPVNQKLSDIFLQLHISERSGRGVPKITEIYGRENIGIKENSIVVTIPFERLGEGNVQENKRNTPVEGKNTPVDTPVEGRNAPDKSTITIVKNFDLHSDKEEKILLFCMEPKGILEIMDFLGYKEKKSVRKLLRPLLEMGRIAMTVPDKPNSKNQKYITNDNCRRK